MSRSSVLAAVLAVVVGAPILAAFQGAPRKALQQAFPETSQRGCSRIFYWGGDRSGGQVRVEFGQPAWKPEYDQAIDKMLGQRWRLGQNFWTSLDSNMDLNAGDVDLPAGLYYLALERRKDDKEFVLWLLDPVEIRDAKLDAFQAGKSTGGIAVPLEHKNVDLEAAKLQISLVTEPQAKDGAKVVIHFGKHQLSASFTMHPTRE